MKKNQNGFGLVEILLVLVLLGLIGGASYYFLKNRNSNSQTSTTSQPASESQQQTPVKTTPKPTSECETSFKKYSDTKAGIEFCYPSAWTLKVDDKYLYTVTLTSSDYKEIEGGYGGSKTGSRVSVWVIDSVKDNYPLTTTKSILDGTEESKMVYTNVKAVKVAGNDGATFIVGYEGPRSLTSQFDQGKKQYAIGLEEDYDGGFNNKDLNQKIVDSFKLQSD